MAMQKQKEKQFIQLFQAAEKAAAACSSGGAEESRCLNALSLLKFFPVTDKILVSTKVEERIQPLIKKHPCKKIRSLAYDLCMTWTNQRLKHAKEQKTASTAAKTTTSVLKDDNNTTFLDKIRQQRDKNRARFYDALCRVYMEVDDQEDIKNQVNACDPEGLAVSLESNFFEKLRRANGCIKGIMEKYRSVLFNIEDPKNPDFRRKVLLGQIKPESVVELSSNEMASDQRHHENLKLAAEALLRRVTGTTRKGTTDQFRCGRCGKRETTYYQLQTRSADEPMTTYVTCVVCSNHWKF